jgi:soluble lytic murein transglycosylase-like protein
MSRAAAVALTTVVAAGSLVPMSPTSAQTTIAPPQSVPSIDAYVTEAARRFGIPERWIRAVMGVESAGDATATSIKGAMGLMQIMPATYADLRSRYGLGPNAYDPRDNILAGTAYLREMYDRYGSPGFLAAYNAGPGRYQDYLAGRTLPAETRSYVARLAPHVDGGAVVQPAVLPDPLAWTRASLFARNWAAADHAAEPAVSQLSTGLPAPVEPSVDVRSESPLASLFVPLSGRRP